VAVPLLLHSLTEHQELILTALDVAGARRVIEVGSEFGGFTSALAEWAAQRGGTSAAVEPFPAAPIRRLDAESETFTLVEGRSPDALRDVPAADAYVLDGDHTYWTVLAELRTIAELAGDGPHPLVFLHDVGWPSGRRDQYYAPDTLPADAVHPHTWTEGVAPGVEGVVDRGGWRGEGSFALALHEGGPRNGVLTAVEDYRAESPVELVYAQVPSVFGLGVLYPRSAPYAAALATLLAPWDGNRHLDRLEQNRLALFLRVIALQDEKRAASRLVVEYADRLAAVEAENAQLRLERIRSLGDAVPHRG
jgi:Methyltransferase domain